MGLYEQLLERERSGRPISVGLVGAGQMGAGFVSQVQLDETQTVVQLRRLQDQWLAT